MPAILLKLLLDPRVLVGIGFFLILTYAGVQSERLKHAKGDLAASRAAARAATASLTASEKFRASEHATAVKAASDAATACQSRVAAAHSAASAIRAITERPARVDPKTKCPVRDLIGADELRNALSPPA